MADFQTWIPLVPPVSGLSRSGGQRLLHQMHARALGSDLTHFNLHPVRDGGTLFGDLDRFVHVRDVQEEKAANGLLGFGERAIRNGAALFVGDGDAGMFQRSASFCDALAGQAFEPIHELADHVLQFLGREILVPIVAAEEDDVAGCRSCCTHKDILVVVDFWNQPISLFTDTTNEEIDSGQDFLAPKSIDLCPSESQAVPHRGFDFFEART